MTGSEICMHNMGMWSEAPHRCAREFQAHVKSREKLFHYPWIYWCKTNNLGILLFDEIFDEIFDEFIGGGFRTQIFVFIVARNTTCKSTKEVNALSKQC